MLMLKRFLQAGARKTFRAAEAGMGATVGLAAKGILPDSSVPTTSSRGPAAPVQEASMRETISAPRALDSMSMTVLPGTFFRSKMSRLSRMPYDKTCHA